MQSDKLTGQWVLVRVQESLGKIGTRRIWEWNKPDKINLRNQFNQESSHED